MASYSYLPPADRFALMHFVRSFHAGPAAGFDRTSCMRSSRRISFRRERACPGQIPIRGAAKHVCRGAVSQA